MRIAGDPKRARQQAAFVWRSVKTVAIGTFNQWAERPFCSGSA